MTLIAASIALTFEVAAQKVFILASTSVARVSCLPAVELARTGGIEEFEMDRRSFMMGLLAAASGGSALIASEPAAASATSGACALPPEAVVQDQNAALPDGMPIEYAQYSRRPVHWHHRGHRYRHHRRRVQRRRVCRVHIDRRGRRVRRCHWVWI
ncbi:hypothetical protein DWE98_22545 [Bosea caraganae]|uniref:Uncharacterized protein n=1 Tax=Bosea caraganae TaxID=2763117 RepID=A0A370L0E6_9HYPH|nr:hypothetical protein [Bosea caraganae]RDJ20749.1 hypothetical protein DWE98_22545 [Bosea caraganae]